MVKVRILSGNQSGNIVDLDQTDAEVNVATGYAEYVNTPAPKHAPTPGPESAKAAKKNKAATADKKAKAVQTSAQPAKPKAARGTKADGKAGK